MKALFIGGTGTISSAVTELAVQGGWELTLLNRGNRNAELPAGVETITADIRDERATAEKLKGTYFDVVADFIAFTPEDVLRDFRLFAGKTGQFIFISSASGYQKPPLDVFITERTPMHNPFSKYSSLKIDCEETLRSLYRKEGFPVTIVRPSHTYSERSMPVGLHGSRGSWGVLNRMLQGKPVIIPGDGSTVWTLTYNRDFAKGFVGLMGNPLALGQSIHITSDERLTWNRIHETIAEALGVELKAYHVSSDFLDSCCDLDVRSSQTGDKTNNAIFDNSRIKELVPDFSCTLRFDQGARLCARYMLSHPETQREDARFDDWCDRVIAELELAGQRIRSGG